MVFMLGVRGVGLLVVGCDVVIQTLDQALYSGTGTENTMELCHAGRERERESAANQRRRHGRGTANLTISARLLIGLPERTTPC